jgi:hypothetical protein
MDNVRFLLLRGLSSFMNIAPVRRIKVNAPYGGYERRSKVNGPFSTNDSMLFFEIVLIVFLFLQD